MTFFDPKEDVLDVEFTQFGKYLLSQGKWNPFYYSFFDDDIDYDAQYGGISEGQNEAQDRIVESVRPRTQYAFAGIETEIKKQLSLIPWGASEHDRISLQPTADRDYALSMPMGRSDIGNPNFPAWSVTFLNGELDSVIPYSTSSLGNIPIVQMTADNVVFKTEVRNKNEEGTIRKSDCTETLDLAKNLNQVGESAPEAEPSDLILANRVYEDGSYIGIDEDYVLLEILEKNTPFEEENVDIQVFKHEENTKGQPVLTPLKFYKKKKMVVNDILLDDTDAELNQQAELTPEYVEYFFNVWVDDEIDIETLCKAVTVRETLGLYAPPIDCPERLPKDLDAPRYDCDPECEECDVCDGPCCGEEGHVCPEEGTA